MLKVDLEKNKTLQFEIDITGTSEPPIPRLIFELNSGISIGFTGRIEGKNAIVDISKIVDYTEDKDLKCKLEVTVEDNFFVPWEDTIQLKEKKKVKAQPKLEVTEKTVEVKHKEEIVEVKSVIKEEIPKAHQEEQPVLKLKKSLSNLFEDMF